MKILSILLFITINTYAQEQKYVDMSNMRQFSFGKCNGIDGNNIPNLSRSFYTAETCQNAYLQDDICNIEASTFKKAFEAGVSIEDGKIVKKDIFLKEYKGQCDSWLKVRTRGCKNFIKREATKCGGRGKYSKNNFLNPSAKTHTGLLKTKDIIAYSESEYQIEKDKIKTQQQRQRLAELEQQQQAEARRLAKLEQQRIAKEKQQAEARKLANVKSSDYRTICAEEIADAINATNLIYMGTSRSEQICGVIKQTKAMMRGAENCLNNHSDKLTQSAINQTNAVIADSQTVINQNMQVGRQLSNSFYCF